MDLGINFALPPLEVRQQQPLLLEKMVEPLVLAMGALAAAQAMLSISPVALAGMVILAAAAAAVLLCLEVRELKLLALVELAALATSSSSQCKENQ